MSSKKVLRPTSRKPKQAARKKSGCLPIFMVLVILLGFAGGIGFGVLTGGASMEPETVEMGPSMYLKADRTDFSVGEPGEIQLTLVRPVGDLAEILDEKGNVILTMTSADAQADGSWTKSITLNTQEEGSYLLTARAGSEESDHLAFFVTPEITAEMVWDAMEISRETYEAVLNEGYESDDFPQEALDFAAKELEADSRVAEVMTLDSAVFFLTKDHVVGACGPGPAEGYFSSGSSQFSDEGYAVDIYRAATDMLPLDDPREFSEKTSIYSENTVTNDRINVVRPLYSTDGLCHVDYHAEKGEQLAEAMYSQEGCHVYNDFNGILSLFAEDIGDVGMWIMNTHGGKVPYEDESGNEKILWTYELSETLTGFDQLVDLELQAGNEFSRYFYGDQDSFKTRTAGLMRLMAYNGTITGTGTFMKNRYQNCTFDNTLIYFGICYSAADPEMKSFFIDRGASTYIGYPNKIHTDIEKSFFTGYMDHLSKWREKDQRLSNSSEASETRLGPIALYNKLFQTPIHGSQRAEVSTTRDAFTFYGEGTLTGTVTAPGNTASTEGAEISLYRYLNYEFQLQNIVHADADGKFSAEHLPWGVYVADVHHDHLGEAQAWMIFQEKEMDGGEILLNGDLYYTYIRDHMLPEMGWAGLDVQTARVEYQNLSAILGKSWNSRKGLLSANVEDLDGDGREDLLVFYFAPSETVNGTYALYAELFTQSEDRQVIPVNRILLADGMGDELHSLDLRAGLMNVQGRRCLYVENGSSAYFADGGGITYSWYGYDGSKLRLFWQIDKTAGGSSDIVYSLLDSTAGGVPVETVLWARAFNQQVMMDGDMGDGIEAGFGLLGLPQPAREHLPEFNYTFFNDLEDTVPTYWGSDLLTPSFQCLVSGAGTYQVRDMQSTVTDGTELQKKIKELGS